MRRYIPLLLVIGVAVYCFGQVQQTNGRNYAPQTVIYGTQAQTSNDSGVNGVVLATPIKIGSTYYWLAQLTASGSQLPGAAGISGNLTGTCTGTGGLFSEYDVSATFPSTWSTSGTQTFCYNEYAVLNQDGTVAQLWVYVLSPDNTANFGTAIYSGNATNPTTRLCATALVHTWSLVAGWNNITPSGCGSLYRGPGKLGSNGRNFTQQYAGVNGTLYSAAVAPDTYIDWSGLSNTVAPTTTTLGNSTHGTACSSWAVTNPNTNLTGSTSVTWPALPVVAIAGGAGYQGGLGLSLLNTAGTAGSGYVTCQLAAAHASVSVAWVWKTDGSATEASGHDYDSPDIKSSDATDGVNFNVATSGTSWYANLECESTSGGTTVSLDGIYLAPGTVYLMELQKNTGGAPNFGAIFNAATHQQVGVTITCNSGTGTHNAQFVNVGITGSETEASGVHGYYGPVFIFANGTFPI